MDTISPVAKKLLIKPGKRWLFYSAPDNYLATIEPLPDGAEAIFSPGGVFDGVQLFVMNSTELIDRLKIIMPILKPDTTFWITYPKKSSGIVSDLEMMSSWDELDKYGYNGVAAAAIDEIWTALRFRPVVTESWLRLGLGTPWLRQVRCASSISRSRSSSSRCGCLTPMARASRTTGRRMRAQAARAQSSRCSMEASDYS